MAISSSLYFPIAVAFGIFIVSLYLYISWSQIIQESIDEIEGLSNSIKAQKFVGEDIFTNAIEVTKNKRIEDLLLESKRNLVTIDGDLGPERYCLKPYADIWTARNVLAGRMNLSLYETMPNILVGAGLMFTFIFLAIALQNAGQAMSGSQKERDQALNGLIATAGGKFITSIAGLFCSLLWNWRAKVSIEKLEAAIDELEVTLRTIASDNAPQAVIHAQLGIFNEILFENREQVGQLKRFETDIALAIAKAIGNALQPSFEELGKKLIESLDKLTDRISSINEDALKDIMEKFLDGIKGDSAKEMAQFKQTLLDVAEKLNSAGVGVGQTFEAAGNSFGTAVNILEKTISKTNDTVVQLESGLDKAKDFANDGSNRLEIVVNSLVTALNGVDKVIFNVDSFVQKIQSSTESLNLVTDSLDDTVASQKSISDEFRVGIPTMSNALKDAINEITIGTSASREALAALRSDFEDTRTAVEETVSRLTSGVSDYSDKVAHLHSTLDQKLAQAVSSINSTIVTLEETMDDFVESLPKNK
jgi:predicted  nucleic acid-binding Zn-ribbon protein